MQLDLGDNAVNLLSQPDGLFLYTLTRSPAVITGITVVHSLPLPVQPISLLPMFDPSVYNFSSTFGQAVQQVDLQVTATALGVEMTYQRLNPPGTIISLTTGGASPMLPLVSR